MLSDSLGFQQEDQPVYGEQKEGWCSLGSHSASSAGLEWGLWTLSPLRDTPHTLAYQTENWHFPLACSGKSCILRLNSGHCSMDSGVCHGFEIYSRPRIENWNHWIFLSGDSTALHHQPQKVMVRNKRLSSWQGDWGGHLSHSLVRAHELKCLSCISSLGTFIMSKHS